MSEHTNAAREIMALVDEKPSEPFSFERKNIETQVASIIDRALGDAFDQGSFDFGYDEGQHDAKYTIRDLEAIVEAKEEQIEELERELARLKDENAELLATLGEIVDV